MRAIGVDVAVVVGEGVAGTTGLGVGPGVGSVGRRVQQSKVESYAGTGSRLCQNARRMTYIHSYLQIDFPGTGIKMLVGHLGLTTRRPRQCFCQGWTRSLAFPARSRARLPLEMFNTAQSGLATGGGPAARSQYCASHCFVKSQDSHVAGSSRLGWGGEISGTTPTITVSSEKGRRLQYRWTNCTGRAIERS